MTALHYGFIRDRPQSEPVRGTSCRRLTAPYLFYDSESGRWIAIPAGFVWDGTSIPRLFWSALGGPFTPKREIAGLIHDFLYRKDIWDDLDRIVADKIFHRVLLLEGNGKISSATMYRGVRVGGRWSYNKKELNWQPYNKAA